MDGVADIQKIKKINFGIRILVLTSFVEGDLVIDAIKGALLDIF